MLSQRQNEKDKPWPSKNSTDPQPVEAGEAAAKDEIYRQFEIMEQYNLVIEKPEEYLQLIMQFGYLVMSVHCRLTSLS